MLSQSTFFSNRFNFNGSIIERNDFSIINRAFLYGDGIFDTVLFKDSKIIFSEDHYFRLLKGMRMLKMEIPVYFTQDFWENEINKLQTKNKFINARVRTTLFRNNGGLYFPKNKDVDFLIQAEHIDFYSLNDIKLGIYKDQFINQTSLNNVKTTNRLINVLASIFAEENNFDNVILLNNQKRVVSTINGNIFLINGNIIKTPLLTEGCIEGVIRKKIISKLTKLSDFKVIETEINLFDCLQAEEIFFSNSVIGIQSIKNFKNKIYSIEKGEEIDRLIKTLY